MKTLMSEYKSRVTIYQNGASIKFDNRMITVFKQEGSLVVELKIIDPNPAPKSAHKHLRGKLHVTTFAISPVAAEALMVLLFDELEKINEETDTSLPE
jgi:hypothetical protein